jgi:hypothetical protein
MLWVAEEWDDFDTWCLLRGIDADSLPARRLVNMACACLTEGLEKDRVTALFSEFERIGSGLIERRKPEPSPIPDAAPPPGWKSDEENWAGVQAALAQMGTIGGAVSHGG